MEAISRPNASSSTLAIGATQLVVHDAFEITLCWEGSYASSFTPRTTVRSSPLAGALITTFSAPASMCLFAFSRSVNSPVDSITIWAPSSFHGSSAGSRTASTRSSSPSTVTPPSNVPTSPSNRPSTESYFRRCASVGASVTSLTATKSQSTPSFLAARKKFLPILPNPLMPIFTLMASSRVGPHPSQSPVWPAGRRSGREASSAIEIAVVDRCREALVAEEAREVLDDHDRTVSPAGAADPDGEVGLPLGHEARDHEPEQRAEPAKELPVRGLALHERPDALVGAGERPELLDPVGVRKEPAVDHEVGVARGTVLVAERHEADLEALLRGCVGERVPHAVAELVRRESGRVDDQVRVAAEGLHHHPFLADPLDHAVRGGKRVPAARGFVPVDQVAIGRLEEQDPRRDAQLRELLERLGELAEVHPAADVEHDRHPAGSARARPELGHLRQQGGREVVHHEVAQVLEAPRRLRAAGAGEAGDDREPLVRGVGDNRSLRRPRPAVRELARLIGRPLARHVARFRGAGGALGPGGHALRLPPAGSSPVRRSWIALARTGPTPGVEAISSSLARAMRATEPTRFSSAFFRDGPAPATSSSGEASARFPRFSRWYVTANR